MWLGFAQFTSTEEVDEKTVCVVVISINETTTTHTVHSVASADGHASMGSVLPEAFRCSRAPLMVSSFLQKSIYLFPDLCKNFVIPEHD